MPRAGWQQKVEELGLLYHSIPSGPYWDESRYFSFTLRQVEELERATTELQRLCMEAAQHIITTERFKEFGIPENAVEAIKHTWSHEPPSLYGRMDLAYDGANPPKLLEYNADTPTSLLEAAVVQWHWLQEVHPHADQWNGIHEALVRKWRDLRDFLPKQHLYFTHIDRKADPSHEDLMTVTYLRDTAAEAGINTEGVLIDQIKIEEFVDDNLVRSFSFLDHNEEPIRSLFKLYPWEWLVHEDSTSQLLTAVKDGMILIEPIWKMLLSNKALLAVLWEMFPGHPNLLPTYQLSDTLKRGSQPTGLNYVIKPLLSREGASTSITLDGDLVEETSGDYGEEGFVVQQYAKCGPSGVTAVIGSWLVDGASVGMGIRASNNSLITDNLAQFVPHLIEG